MRQEHNVLGALLFQRILLLLLPLLTSYLYLVVLIMLIAVRSSAMNYVMKCRHHSFLNFDYGASNKENGGSDNLFLAPYVPIRTAILPAIVLLPQVAQNPLSLPAHLVALEAQLPLRYPLA